MGRVILMLGVALIGASMVWGKSGETRVTPAEQCAGQNFENLRERVKVEPCSKSLCKLRKGTNSTVEIHFTPDEEIKDLVTYVTGELIAGLPLPFIGVTGASACNQIKNAASGENAPCPLKAGVEYIYTNSFPIEAFYPEVPVKVHWALQANNKDVICFEVPARIAKAKS